MAKFDAYVICTSPRSGSTLLCSMLAATGVAGNPESYFHRPSIAEWLAGLGMVADPREQEQNVLAAIFQKAVTEGSGGTGMFGLRLQRHSFDYFADKLAVLHPWHSGDLTRVEAAFGRTLFIHLSRTDKVEQAISLVKAQQTGLWHRAADGSELERLSPPAEPVYDAAAIQSEYERLTQFDRDWNDWFASQAIEPLRLSYDALADDPGAVLREVLGRLRLDTGMADGIAPGIARLADDTNRQWARRFRDQGYQSR